MTTLSERLLWIIANRSQENGKPWHAKALSLASGLGQNHVGQYIRGQLSNPTTETIRKIAAAGKVSVGWLADGKGSPDAVDATEPSVSESELPVIGNAAGFTDVLAEDRRSHPEIEERYWQAAAQSAAFLLQGPALPGDALRLARLAEELSDPARLLAALRDAQERVRRLEAAQPGKAEAFQRKVDAARAPRARRS